MSESGQGRYQDIRFLLTVKAIYPKALQTEYVVAYGKYEILIIGFKFMMIDIGRLGGAFKSALSPHILQEIKSPLHHCLYMPSRPTLNIYCSLNQILRSIYTTALLLKHPGTIEDHTQNLLLQWDLFQFIGKCQIHRLIHEANAQNIAILPAIRARQHLIRDDVRTTLSYLGCIDTKERVTLQDKVRGNLVIVREAGDEFRDAEGIGRVLLVVSPRMPGLPVRIRQNVLHDRVVDWVRETGFDEEATGDLVGVAVPELTFFAGH